MPKITLALAALVAAPLLVAGTSAPSSADRPPSGVPKDVAAAYKKMHCKFGDAVSGTRPTHKGASCFTSKYGEYKISHYDNTKAGREWWLDYWLDSPTAWIAVKGHLIVTFQDYHGNDGPYAEKETRWAANQIGGRAVHA